MYNEKLMKENAQEFQKQFQKYFPQYKNYFAVKATPNPRIILSFTSSLLIFWYFKYILKILKSAGMGADCSSMAELILAEKGNQNNTDIIRA